MSFEVHLIDGTYELFRHFFAVPSRKTPHGSEIGAVRGVETIDKIRAGKDVEANTELLRDLCDVMTQGSLCAMGGLTPNPVLSALNTFPEDFASPVIATG